MNNDQEPPGEGTGEDRPADSGTPRDGGPAERRDESARDADSARRSGGGSGGNLSGVSSDAGWRQALWALGVDLEHDRQWQSEGRAGEQMGERKAAHEARRDKTGGEAGEGSGRAGSGQGGGEMEERAQWVSESEVSIERLYELFDGAYMECDLDEDGDLRVVTDSGPRIFLSLHEPNKLIRYMAFYKFREEAIEYDKLLFVNALNDDIVFIRFSLNGADTLIADYYLPYARGSSPFHIINAAKLMGRVITSGIRQHDTNNLLE